jgi:RNA polymerase sigma-70 factor (ECF subfamily)
LARPRAGRRVAVGLLCRPGMPEPNRSDGPPHDDAETTLAARYRAPLVAMLTRRLRDHGRAEDLCHDALGVAMEALRQGRVRDPQRLPAYLFATARNLVRRSFRTSWREQELEAEGRELEDGALDPEQAALLAERRRQVRRLLLRLAERDRLVLEALFLQEVESAALCAALGLTAAQLAVVRHRALKRLARLWVAATHE